MSGFETVDNFARQQIANQVFNIRQDIHFICTDKRYCDAGRTRSTRSANAMNIVFRHIRQIVVDDMGQFRDVDAARRDIGRHQHFNLTFLEFGQSTRSCALAFVTVNRRRIDVIFFQLCDQPVCTPLGASENKNLIPAIAANQVCQQTGFFAPCPPDEQAV